MVASVRSRLTPEQIADGAGNPGIAELVALVHRVNPTDWGHTPDEQARRYLLKSRLQSRLIREWAEHLDLRLDGELVSITHRGLRDAAHVPLHALDPDARERVRQALDVPDGPADPPDEPPERVEPTGDALAAGRLALEAWDYPTARARFEEAVAAGRGEPACHALLELLVDHLGSDEEALALDVEAGSARVARLVAVAHARSGDPREASALLRRLGGAAESEVRLLLAERGLRSGATAEVRTQLDALRALDPANGALTAIADALRELESQGWAPLEAALTQAIGDDAVRAAAEALLAAAPSHPKARAALSALARRQEQDAAASARAAAEADAAAGRWDLAVAALERARDHGADVADALKTARCALAGVRAEQAVAEVTAAHAGGDLQPYLHLTEVGRAVVRDRCADPRLERLEQLLLDRAADPVGALRALEQAEAELAAGRPHPALAVLCAAKVADLPIARTLARAARAAVVRDTALADLARLRTLVGQGAVAAAMALAERLRVSDLPEEDQAAASALCIAAGEAWTDQGTRNQMDRYVEQQLLFDARRVAERQVARRPSDPEWTGRLEAVEAQMRQWVPSWVTTPWHPTAYECAPVLRQMTADACLEADGRHAWLVESRTTLCFLRRIEVGTDRVVSCTVIVPPFPILRPRTAVFGSRVWMSSCGAALALQVGADGAVTRLDYAADLGPEVAACDPGHDPALGLLVLPIEGPRFVWTDGRTGTSTALRNTHNASQVLAPGRGPRVLIHDREGWVRLLDPRSGTCERVGWARQVSSATGHPTRDEVVVLGWFQGREEREVAVLDPTKRSPRVRAGLGCGYDGAHHVASSRAHGVLYVLLDHGGRRELRAFDGDLRPLWSVTHPGLHQLLTDADENHVAIQVLTAGGLRLCALGEDALVLPADAMPDVASASMKAELEAAVARFDRARSPAEQFACLDVPVVWFEETVGVMALLATAAMGWTEGPVSQRIHAVAAFVDASLRGNDDGLVELEGRCVRWLAEHVPQPPESDGG